MDKRKIKGEKPTNKVSIRLRPITKNDKEWIARVVKKWWGSTDIVTRGQLIGVTTLPGFLATRKKTLVGLVTYRILGNECEIVTLNSLMNRKGIGARLVNKVKKVAVSSKCKRLFVITTNDNMDALRFYQKHGFSLVAVHRNALEQSRCLKKDIPLIGQNGIPLRDEIELEMLL